jgi:4-cresol dehydrogenase (hydroxylating)
MAVLPPGITAKTFASAVAEFSAAVGSQWVFTSDDDVYGYRDSYSIVWDTPEERVPAGAVAPANVEQVQAVVRIANKYKIPLYPVSTGRNLSYGGAAPAARGSVVLDLKRMNKILKVDDTRNFCLVEPGVTYFDLYNYVKEHKLNVWLDLPDPGWGSPVGNSLDHGIGYTTSTYRDHFGAHCGMEVVLPNGELVRTGMGAMPNADTWQDFKYGTGPMVDGLFAQGNFGVVTKMGFHMMPAPQAYLSGVMYVPRHADLIPLVKVVNALEDQNLIGMPLWRSPVRDVSIRAGVADPDLTALMAGGWPSMAQIEAYVAKKGVPAYGVQLQLYGPRKTLEGTWEYAQEQLKAVVPNATFAEVKRHDFPLTPEIIEDIGHRYTGVPSLEIFNIVSRNENSAPNPPDGHNNCVAILPRTGEALMQFSKAVIEGLRSVGDMRPWTPFTTPITWHPRVFFSGPSVFTQRDDPDANAKNKKLYETLVDKYAEYGWVDYRCAPAYQDRVMSKYSFNNHALMRLHETIKDAMDPNGIISPGRYGIWPKNQRKPRA